MSYRNIARLKSTEGTDADVAAFIRGLTFTASIGNLDMHLKNGSQNYPDRRRAALAPLYDFVSTNAFIADSSAALTSSRTKRLYGFAADELAHLAAKALPPGKFALDTERETVARVHCHWVSEKRNFLPAGAAVTAIDDHLLPLPRTR